MEIYDFPYIGNVIIPTDELHYFFRGIQSTNQIFPDESQLRMLVCVGMDVNKGHIFRILVDWY
jgi:hypothetical protein